MRTFAVLTVLLVSGLVNAQAPGQANVEFAKKVAPFIDEHTMAVVRMDMSRVPLDAVVKFINTFSDGVETEEIVPTLRAWLKDFTGKGGRDVFLTYGPGDFPNLPVLIAPIAESPKERKDLAELLKMPLGSADTITSAHLHGCVCVGTKDALATIKTRKAVARPDLLDALQVGNESFAQLAFTLTKDARKIHEQIVPFLPDDFGGGDIKTITRGFKWLALTVDGGPKLPVKIIVEAVDKETIQKFQQMQAKLAEATPKLLGEGDPEQTALLRKKWEALTKTLVMTTEGNRLTTQLELGTALAAFTDLPEAKLAADRARSFNNMKQLMLALHSYHDTHGHMPTDIRDKEGKALLSWRVAILPYLEQEPLYKQFKLEEPWDSTHNSKLAAQMPKLFRSARQAATLTDKTTYLAPLGKGFAWDEPNGVKLTDFLDGTSNTIVLVEADDARAVTWTRPDDFRVDPKDPLKGLLGHFGTGFPAALGDGSVMFFPKSITPTDLWGYFTRSGGEVTKFPK